MDQLIREELRVDHTHLVICGGDGSLNEAINGLPDFSRPIGIYPLGRGNDFIKNFSLPGNWAHLLGENYREVDIGKCNDRLFHNGIGAGFDGQIIINMMNSNSLFKGHAAYYYHVVKILSTYKERDLHFTIDGREFNETVLLILVANGTTFGGGFKLAPEADLDNGLLDVCIITRISAIRRFLNLSRLKAGKHLDMKEAIYLKGKKIKISAGDIHGQIDGEYFGTPPYEISVLSRKLKVLIP